MPQVRVIAEDGDNLGVMPAEDAVKKAEEAGFDLVEISPSAKPPVCKITDYGKFKYQKSKKQQDAKKKQHVVHLKEIKLHVRTEQHDFDFKMKHAIDFLLKGDRVKVTVVFRGREIANKEMGEEMHDKVEEVLSQVATPEKNKEMDGRNMVTYYSPDKRKIKEYKKEHKDVE